MVKRLYTTARWLAKRKEQLRKEPLCAYCLERGQVVPANVADHVVPHRGDHALFWNGRLQSLCSPCHDSRKKIEEFHGYATDIGIDGWPIDHRHPVYGRRGSGRERSVSSFKEFPAGGME
jgi:hypothetical protein